MSASAARGASVTRAEFLQLFAAVFLPMFMAAVDQTLLATATPAIAATLGGLRDTSWIAVGYLLASATIVPVYGRLGDRRGRRDLLLVALGVFTLGSLACGVAQSFPQLVAARVLQGLGGGGLMTMSQALIGELVPPRERVRFQAWFALVFTASSIAGPVIGGIVVSHASWRWLFLANLPLAAFAAWRVCRLPRGERPAQLPGGIDAAGHVLFAIGALAMLYWLTSGGHRFSWGSMQSLALAATGAAALAARDRLDRELRGRHHGAEAGAGNEAQRDDEGHARRQQPEEHERNRGERHAANRDPVRAPGAREDAARGLRGGHHARRDRQQQESRGLRAHVVADLQVDRQVEDHREQAAGEHRYEQREEPDRALAQ